MESASRRPGPEQDVIRIALINNMPDGAFIASEQQFRSIIGAALPDARLHFLLFNSRAIRRKPEIEVYAGCNYIALDQLQNYHFDAVVVTGAEPVAANLRDEPFWADLSFVFDLVNKRRTPTLFSCLAAHAAVLHYDGIPRVRLERKRSGIFAQTFSNKHDLHPAGQNHATIPHSRWNTLDSGLLHAAGYSILSHVGADVDIFTKQHGSPMLFLQGHPEYDAHTLRAEYQRDLMLYWCGKREQAPNFPVSYFDTETQNTISGLMRSAVMLTPAEACRQLVAILSLSNPANTWRDSAGTLIGSWMKEAFASRRSAVPLTLELA